MDQDQSNINPLAVVFLLVVGFITLRGERPAAIKALLAIAAFVPLGQQVVLFGLHFQFFRILLLVGFFRIMSRGEARGFVLNTADKIFIAWVLVGLVCSTLRDPSSFFGSDCLGRVFNCCGVYFFFRLLVVDPEEVLEHLRFLAFVAVIIAAAMAWEVVTHRNLFHVFGGVPEITVQREDRFRCQGSFRHPILAGTFAASLFPLMAGLWLRGGRDRRVATVGIACSMFSTCVAASSGALMTCLTAMLGLGLWPLRDRMQLIRRGIVVAVIGFAVVMKQPVWYLIARVSDLVGGEGWHRSYLIDQFVNHFNEWWLIGSSYTAHWAPGGLVLAVDPNNMDITNHYVVQGLQGGLLRLVLFIAMITCCFKIIGRSVRSEIAPPLDRKLLWALGATLAAHCAAFVSVSYFDQIEIFWFWLLAVIATVGTRATEVAAEAENAEVSDQPEEPEMAGSAAHD